MNIKLSHFNQKGAAHMVDVSDKAVTLRVAIAQGNIRMKAETLELITNHKHKKGDVLGIARIAGIMAAKKTADLIPLCHPLALTKIDIDFQIKAQQISCQAEVSTEGKTGVEMEALTAVQIALLTIYDMCKGVDRGMTISEVQLMKKQGGKSGTWSRG